MLFLALILNLLTSDTVICTSNCISNDYLQCDVNNLLECIPKEWWCDGHPDCDSGKDEANCPLLKCKENEFLCNSGTQCVPKLLVCDGTAHCFDKSDEINCKKPIQKSCDSISQYDCDKNGEICVPLAKVCDNKNDCGRNQDELPGNSVANCQRNDCRRIPNGGCSHYCANFFIHIKCYCPLGYQLLTDNKTCQDIDECSLTPPRCSQICKNTLGGYKCHCKDGYTLDLHNPGKCIATDGKRLLLITLNGGRLLTIDLNTGANHSNIINMDRQTWPIIDVDLYHHPQTLFWSTKSNGSIGLVNINFNSNKNVKYKDSTDKYLSSNHNESFCTGMTFDWLRGLLFWTSATENRIYVTNTISNYTSVFLSENLHNPRSIVVDPLSTMLYWVSWKAKVPGAKIERMLMNSEKRQIIIENGLRQPSDLTIDFYDRKLYWSDIDPGSISSIDLSDLKITKIITSNKLIHPFSIAIFENRIYWSDWRQNQIISVDKSIGDDFMVLSKVTKPLTILALNKLTQPQPNESQAKWDPCLNSKKKPCSHICLSYPPKQNQKYNIQFKCLCSNETYLAKDKQSCMKTETSIHSLGNSNRHQIILGVVLSLVLILCLSLSIICVYICRQRIWSHSNKCGNRKSFNHPIVTGDLMFIFKCSSHSSQLSELLGADFNSTSTA